VNAFFATGDDVRNCLGDSAELRRFFDDDASIAEAYALLVMKKEERQVFAPDTMGERIVNDVAKVSVSFSDHRVIAPSSTAAETRIEVGKRIIGRLAEVALTQIARASENASELKARKAHLSVARSGARSRHRRVLAPGAARHGGAHAAQPRQAGLQGHW
jgi:hypothetical protein